LFIYDPTTGVLKWRASGRKAGCLTKDGYLQVNINKSAYYVHRIVWAMVHGRWPAELLDHRNRNKADARISELREATNGQNKANSRANEGTYSGIKGVTWHIRKKRWLAHIRTGGLKRHLGYFDDVEDARKAYEAAAREAWGEFARSEPAPVA